MTVHDAAVLDTSIIAALKLYDPSELPDTILITAVTLRVAMGTSIAVPPLRRRMADLRYLAQHLLEESNRGESRQFNGFGDDVWELFSAYNWPGNVEELLAVIREARSACNEPLIRAKDLPFRFRAGVGAQAVGPVIRPQLAPLEPFLAKAEKQQIEQALKECRHNKSRAARLLGMTRPRLYRRMEILGIRDEPASA